MANRLASAKELLFGLGLMALGWLLPIVYPTVPPKLAVWGVRVGLLLVAWPVLQLGIAYAKAVTGPQRAKPGRLVRDLPYRLVTAARGFLAPTAPTVQEVIAEAVFRDDAKAFHRLQAAPAGNQLIELLRAIYNENERSRHLTFNFLVERQQMVLRDASNTLAALIDDDLATGPSIRGALVTFHESYVTAVRCLHDFGREGIELTEQPFSVRYREWEAAHHAYCDRLRELREHTGFATIRGAITDPSLFNSEEWRWHSRYWSANRALAELTPPQRLFLGLFTEANPPALGELASPVMLFPIYQAGRLLVEKRLLLFEALGDGIERFTVSEPGRRAWFEQGHSGPFPQRDTVDLPLRNVFGSGASGGGAGR